MYDVLSEDYDRFVNWKERLDAELLFLERLISSLSPIEGEKPRILDAACGTGMHAIALAQRGYHLVGADLSPQMINRARENAFEAGVTVRFETAGFGEMAALFGEQCFDAVLCLGNSLPHLLSEEELFRALVDFYHLLRPKGKLLIQNRNFHPVLKNHQREMEPQSMREGNREWLFIRFYDFLPDGLIRFNFLTLSRQGEQGWKQRWESALLRPILSDELGTLLERAGFEQVKTFGNLAGEPFDLLSSPNLVVLAVRG